MWFSLFDQTAYFLWSIALGAVAAALYDLLCAARTFLHAGRLRILVSDIVFFVISGVLTSLFALPFNKGSVRVFIVFGEAVGFLCYRLTLGRFLSRFYSILSKGLKWILKKICDLLKNFFDLVLKTTAFVVYNVNVLIDRFQQKSSAHRKQRKINQYNSRTVRKKKRRHIRKAVHSRHSGRSKRKRNGYEREYEKEKKKRSRRERGR